MTADLDIPDNYLSEFMIILYKIMQTNNLPTIR
jgi:hypothetical protein